MENEEHSWAKFEAEDNERTLSFRNFSMPNNIQGSALHSPTNPSSAEEELIFQFDLPSPLIYTNNLDTIFYNEEEDEEHLNEYQKRDYLTVLRSNSFSTPSPTTHEALVSKDYLGSIRYSYSSKQSPSPASYPVQKKKVNITSLTSMSEKSRRMMFMFGPVKFEPEMELNAIKERQSRSRRRVPATIFPAPDGVSGTGKKRGNSNYRSKMMKSIKGTVHMAAVLARSIACVPLSIAAMAHKH